MSVQLFTSHGIKHGNSSMNVPPELIEVHLGVPYIKLVAQSVPLMKAIFPEVKRFKKCDFESLFCHPAFDTRTDCTTRFG